MEKRIVGKGVAIRSAEEILGGAGLMIRERMVLPSAEGPEAGAERNIWEILCYGLTIGEGTQWRTRHLDGISGKDVGLSF